jgi:hypothetical protein
MLNVSPYYDRKAQAPVDGRAFKERTLQAVNRTAYNVTSYRQLIISLAQAKAGDTIVVSEIINVPSTILIAQQITLRCEGRGGFIPGVKDLTMFQINDVANVFFTDVRVLKNEDIRTATFIEHRQAVVERQTLRNITIRRCFAVCDVFVSFLVSGLPPKNMTRSLGPSYAWHYLGNRSLIVDNIHYAETKTTGRLMEGSFYMCTVTNNETRFGSIVMDNGTGNIITSNVISGEVDAAGNPASVVLDVANKVNSITSNIINHPVLDSLGAAPVDNTVANNQEFMP